MIRGVIVLFALLAGYEFAICELGGALFAMMLAMPQLTVLMGKARDPLGALMFAVYAAAESAVAGAVVFLVAWGIVGRGDAISVALLAVSAVTLREVYRYLSIDHYRPRSMRFGLACGLVAFFLMLGLALFPQ